MYHVKYCLLLSFIFLCPNAFSAEYPLVTGFIDQSMLIDNRSVDYQVYLPKNYQEKENWPVILFLHGAGERGENPLLATEVGLGRAIRLKPEKFPAIGIFPQCPSEEWWSSPQCEAIALKSLYEVANKFSIDNKRVYLTGVSMGGYGAWHLASKNPELWSALYVISGRVKPGGGHVAANNSVAKLYSGEALYEMTAKAVAHIPIWIAHGEQDEVVPVSESRQMYKYLQLEKASVNYSEFSKTWHNAWDKAYANEKAINWLFSQHKDKGVFFAAHK